MKNRSKYDFDTSGITSENVEEMQQIKELALANGTYLKAPNGKPTKLDERQWLQVRTTTFKKWFGDWQNDPKNASKVIDENGEPMVVYHGGLNNFSVFRTKSKWIKYKDDKGNIQKFFWSTRGSLGEGAYFTPNKNYAMQYTGGNYGEMGDGELYEVFLNIRNLGRGSIYGKKGYDGARGNGTEDDVYMVTTPNQIKSATKNTGLFNSEKNSILNAPELEYKLNKKQYAMEITHKNLTQIYPTLDQAILPKSLQRVEYEILTEMLDLYDDDDDIQKFIDSFCRKLSAVVGNPITTNSRKDFETAKKDMAKKEIKEKTAVKTAKPKAEKVVKPKKAKAVKPEKPKPKEIEKIPADVAFIKRYANFHKKTKTKKQVWDLLKAIQKAIAEKVLRKSDKYSQHIEHIQKQLTKCYRTMGNSIAVQLDEKAYEQYKTIANSLVVSDSVKMFKAFLRFHSNPDDKVAREILTKAISPKTNLEQSVVRSLQNYINRGTYDISEQELNGIYDAVGETKSEKKKPVANAKSVVNSEDFAKMHFDTLQLTGKFQRLIGTPSTNFSAMVYGSPGSGKTTFCLMFADYLSKTLNKNVLFATIEEGLNHTFQEKLKRMKAIHPNLSIAEYLPDNLAPFDVIILDSVNTFGYDSKKLRSLRKANPNKIFIWIFQTTKNGVFRGSQEYQHDCDVVIAVKDGIATTENQKNRFGAGDTFKVYTAVIVIRKKIEKFLTKFPKNAKNWDKATDEIRDLSRFSREYLEEIDKTVVEALNFRSFTTPAQWNTKGREYILANFNRMSEQAKIAFYERFEDWFE